MNAKFLCFWWYYTKVWNQTFFAYLVVVSLIDFIFKRPSVVKFLCEDPPLARIQFFES